MTKPEFDIVTEYDATPFVLSVAHVLGLSTEHSQIRARVDQLGQDRAVVGLIGIGTPQSATLAFEPDRVTIGHGLAEARLCTISLNLEAPLEIVDCDPDTVSEELRTDISRLLNPPLIDWRIAANQFWQQTGGDSGMPDRLIVTSVEGETIVLGDDKSGTEYSIAGDETTLARIFMGLDAFIDHLLVGSIATRGTLSQISVMTGSSWKVMQHG